MANTELINGVYHTSYRETGGGGGTPNAVQYVPQTLTDAQKAQARQNIGGASAADLNQMNTALGNLSSIVGDMQPKVQALTYPAYVEAWDGASTPVVANIPAGVTVTYNDTDYTGTLAASASTLDKIYLVSTGTTDNYYRYVTGQSGSTYSWANIGSTEMSLSDYATSGEFDELNQRVGDYETTSIEVPISIGATASGSVRYSTGANASASDKHRSGFIDISGKTTLIYSRQVVTASSPLQGLAFYNSEQTYISGQAWVGSADAESIERTEITVPTNAKYVKFCWLDTFASSIYLKYPSTQTVYSSGLGKDVQDLMTDVDGIEEKVPEIPVVTFSDNLLDPDAITDGYILDDDTSGGIHASSDYYTTDYMPVVASAIYQCSKGIRRIVFYDTDKGYLSRTDSVSAKTDITPSVNGYVRVSIKKASSSPVNKTYFGDKTKDWEASYGVESITVDDYPLALASAIPVNVFADKKMAIIGDSSTTPTNWPTRLGVLLGVAVCDVYAASGYTWRNKYTSGNLSSCIGVLINTLLATEEVYDIILIQLGGNDLGGTTEQMGTVGNAFDSYNYKTLANATDSASCVRYYLELLKRKFPNALLVVDTVFQRIGSKTGESAKSINDILRASCQRLGIVCLDGESIVGFSCFTEPCSPYYNDGTPGEANDRTNLSRSNPIYNYIEDSTGDIVDYATATDDGELRAGYSKRYGLYTYDGKHQNLRGENKVLDFMVASLRSLYQSDSLQHTDDQGS